MLGSKKIGFVINSRAKGVKQLKSNALHIFNNYDVNFYETTYAGQAIVFAENIVENNFDYLVIVGGDGTINEVVNGCLKNNRRQLDNVLIGVLPYGSGNDFSKSLGVTNSINDLKELIENNSFVPIDIGKLVYETKDGESQSRYFVNIADVGIGGVAVEKLNNITFSLGTKISYHLSILQSFFTYKRVEIELSSKDLNWKGETLCICMANGNYFANGMCIAPQANLVDGMFQLVIMGKVSVLDYLKNLSKIKKGINLDHPEVFYYQIDECAIKSNGETCPIDMDGEFIGYTPLKLSIINRGLCFLTKNELIN